MHEEADFWLLPPPAATHAQVTVVIPCFCAADTLLRAARSALDQSLADVELLIVDDASNDGSWQVVTQLAEEDSRVSAILHKRNCGKAIAMNRAIAHAHGRWVAVLDADDWYHYDRLAELVALGERCQADLVADNQFLYDAPAASVVGTAWSQGETAWELDFDGFLSGSNAYETFNFGMLKPVLRLDFLRRTGLGYEPAARHGQDFFHLLEFYLLGGKAVVSDRAYYYYTQPYGDISRRWSRAGRKRYDFQNAYEINQRYQQSAEAVLSLPQLRHLRARTERLKLLESYYRSKEAALHGDFATAIGLLARNPKIFGYLCRRIYARLVKRPAFITTLDRIAEQSRRREEVNARPYTS